MKFRDLVYAVPAYGLYYCMKNDNMLTREGKARAIVSSVSSVLGVAVAADVIYRIF